MLKLWKIHLHRPVLKVRFVLKTCKCHCIAKSSRSEDVLKVWQIHFSNTVFLVLWYKAKWSQPRRKYFHFKALEANCWFKCHLFHTDKEDRSVWKDIHWQIPSKKKMHSYQHLCALCNKQHSPPPPSESNTSFVDSVDWDKVWTNCQSTFCS